MIGYVYVLSNPSMPGIYKIGYTSNNITKRVSELSSPTNMPTPFEIKHSLFVPDMEIAEALLHNELKQYRMNPNREFFKVDNFKIIEQAFGSLFWEFHNHIKKMADNFSISGREHYKKTYISFLDKDFETIKKHNYNYEWYSNIFLKDNIYYIAHCYSPVCTKDQFDKWVTSKQLLELNEQSKVLVVVKNKS